MCVSLTSDSSEIFEVIIVKLSTLIASVMGMHHVLVILTLAFIQGHTDRNHENNKGLIISETIHDLPIKFSVKIVRLKVCTIIANLKTMTFIQGHKGISNWTSF